ncbi:MAG: hypothetical protein IH855_12125 [Bacteroidetes bacterium]|nr:hypothetical protein [Bacteroidota bacterium]
MRRTLFSLLLPALLLGALPAANAQNATGERVLRSWTSDVKLDNGSQARWTFTFTYNSEAGEYAETITDEDGALIERTVGNMSMVGPTPGEIEMARAVIFADPELSELYERAANPELSGGFILQREAGHPCGPGSRCLQFDMFDVDVIARRVNRIRYVVVDVRDGTLVSKDFDPSADGNATRFNGNPAPTR